MTDKEKISQGYNSLAESSKLETPSASQIIIDGVDVSGCEFYCDKYCNLSNERNEKLPFAEKCSEYSDCLYKQLKRKEQECDNLTSQLDFAVQQTECLEQQYKELQEDLLNCTACRTTETLKKQLDQLKAENEELKEKFKTFFDIANQQC